MSQRFSRRNCGLLGLLTALGLVLGACGPSTPAGTSSAAPAQTSSAGSSAPAGASAPAGSSASAATGNPIRIGVPLSLTGTFAATGEQLQPWLLDAQINRDRNLRLQYLAGLGINNYEQTGIYSEILRHGAWPEGAFRGELGSLSSLRDEVRARRP